MTDTNLRCSKIIRNTWHSQQCSRRWTVIRDGKHYCKVHDPVEEKKKADEKQKKLDAQYAKENAERNRRMAEKTYCFNLTDLELETRIREGKLAK